jgi:hypothetical protein
VLSHAGGDSQPSAFEDGAPNRSFVPGDSGRPWHNLWSRWIERFSRMRDDQSGGLRNHLCVQFNGMNLEISTLVGGD